MDEKTRDAEYAATNLSTLKYNIAAYVSYAHGLVADVEMTDAHLYDKLYKAEKGVNDLIRYIQDIIKQSKQNPKQS